MPKGPKKGKKFPFYEIFSHYKQTDSTMDGSTEGPTGGTTDGLMDGLTDRQVHRQSLLKSCA